MSISSYHRPSLSASCLLAACMWECEGFFLGSPAPACQAWGFQLLRCSLPLRPWRQAHLHSLASVQLIHTGQVHDPISLIRLHNYLFHGSVVYQQGAHGYSPLGTAQAASGTGGTGAGRRQDLWAPNFPERRAALCLGPPGWASWHHQPWIVVAAADLPPVCLWPLLLEGNRGRLAGCMVWRRRPGGSDSF